MRHDLDPQLVQQVLRIFPAARMQESPQGVAMVQKDRLEAAAHTLDIAIADVHPASIEPARKGSKCWTQLGDGESLPDHRDARGGWSPEWSARASPLRSCYSLNLGRHHAAI